MDSKKRERVFQFPYYTSTRNGHPVIIFAYAEESDRPWIGCYKPNNTTANWVAMSWLEEGLFYSDKKETGETIFSSTDVPELIGKESILRAST